MNDDEIMMNEEFFDGVQSNKGVGCSISPRPQKGRTKKTFADIKARMVMRVYGVTREKAEKIISDRAAGKAEALAAAKVASAEGDCGADGDELMSAEEFFGA